MKAITIYSGGSVLTGKGNEYYPAAEVDAYRAKVRALVEAVKAEPMPTGEPQESAWLGRQQVADELAALEAE